MLISGRIIHFPCRICNPIAQSDAAEEAAGEGAEFAVHLEGDGQAHDFGHGEARFCTEGVEGDAVGGGGFVYL